MMVLPARRLSSLPVLRYAMGLVLLALLSSLPGPARAQSAASPDAQREDANRVLQDVQAAYNALDGLRATFTQTIVPSFANDSTQIRGVLLLKDDRYRVETARETFVTNGATTWVYAPADSQVVVNHASHDPSTVSPQTLFMDYTDQYQVKRMQTKAFGGVPHRVLHLVPTDDDARFQSIRLWVRRADALVTRLRVVDASDSVIRIAFDDLVRNPDLGPSAFTFDPPPGVDVVDLRSS